MTTPRTPHAAGDSLFSSPTFSSVAWINNILASSPSPAHLSTSFSTPSQSSPTPDPASPHPKTDHALTSHLAALSSARADAHAELDTALAAALSAVPWVVRESEKVRQRAAAVRAGVDGVGERVAGVEGSVSDAVAGIASADMLVRRVEGTAEMLAQTAAADALLGRLGSLLGSGSSDGSDLVSAADVVAELRAALEPLRGIQGMEGRFGELDGADDRLGALAEPRLLSALEARAAVGARNARIVFDRAGRAGAFCGKYVELRHGLISGMWTEAWGSPPSATADSATTASDLTSTRAGIVLDGFYKKLADFVQVESAWLGDVFPDLRPQLLPDLLIASMREPVAPSVDDLRPRPATVQVSGINRMHQASIRATRAAAEIAHVLVCDLKGADGDDSTEFVSGAVDRVAEGGGSVPELGLGLGLSIGEGAGAGSGNVTDGVSNVEGKEIGEQRIFDAVVSILFPCSVFWSVWPALAASTAETSALAIPIGENTGPSGTGSPPPPPKSSASSSAAKLPSSRRSSPEARSQPVPLADIAKLLQAAFTPLLAVLDSLETQISDWTVGVGVLAVPAATAAASAVVSRRAIALIQRDQQLVVALKSRTGDDWGRVAGALSLLLVVGSLKQSWEARKEACKCLAGEPTSGMLEVAVALRGNPRACIARLLELADADMWAEASVVMQLVLNNNLSTRVAETIRGSVDGDRQGGDFCDLIDAVHRAAYDAMFAGIRQRFQDFEKEASWGNPNVTGDGVESMAGFSSSPLSYATEIADYMMTIPQQLEPYVPAEDEEDFYSTPSSVFAFSASGSEPVKNAAVPGVNKGKVSSLDETSEDNRAFETHADDGIGLSFAGMWIGAVAIGTMELYVEKIIGLSRLSKSGAKQLTIDAEYICNVLAALGVVPSPELDLCRRVLDCCSLDPVSLKLIRDEQGSEKHHRIVEKIVNARGFLSL